MIKDKLNYWTINSELQNRLSTTVIQLKNNLTLLTNRRLIFWYYHLSCNLDRDYFSSIQHYNNYYFTNE